MRYLLISFAFVAATSIAVAASPPVRPWDQHVAPTAPPPSTDVAASLPVQPWDQPWGTPISELPAQVVAEANVVTLFADFGHTEVKGVPVYVVNRTAAPIPLSTQDGDLFLKLEYESAPNTWVRAQSHEYSWCGMSYHERSLDPGRFVVIMGHRPMEGEKAKVRYGFYGHDAVRVRSNLGDGVVSMAEVERAASDEMIIRAGDFEFVRKVALAEIEATDRQRWSALDRLSAGKFDRAEVKKVLGAVTMDRDKALAERAARVYLAIDLLNPVDENAGPGGGAVRDSGDHVHLRQSCRCPTSKRLKPGRPNKALQQNRDEVLRY